MFLLHDNLHLTLKRFICTEDDFICSLLQPKQPRESRSSLCPWDACVSSELVCSDGGGSELPVSVSLAYRTAWKPNYVHKSVNLVHTELRTVSWTPDASVSSWSLSGVTPAAGTRPSPIFNVAHRGGKADRHWLNFFQIEMTPWMISSAAWICPQLFPDSEQRSPVLGIEPQPRAFSSSSLAAEKTGWSRCPEQLLSVNAGPTCAWESVSLWHLRTLRRHRTARPSSSSEPTLCLLSLYQTVMFSRSKKRRDGVRREVGRWPKVRRLHGALRDAFRLQIRCLL